MIKLTFTNTNDLPGLLYQSGYAQEVYLDATMNTPVVQTDEEPVQDGFGSTKYTFARVSLLTRFDAPDMGDDSLFALHLAKYHDTITAKDLDTGSEYDVVSLNVSEVSQPNGLAKVSVELIVEQITVNGCGQDYTLTTC